VYEDEVILVAKKPSGLMVEPDRNNYPNLLQEVKKYLAESNGIKGHYAQHLHRLDRVVSGVILFVKDKRYLHNLSNQFAERRVEKYYEALTDKAPAKLSDKLVHWHRKEKKKGMIVPEETPYAEQVRLNYTVSPSGNFYLWQIQLHTGKFHQIRAQLGFIGCPVIGDALYGSTASFKPDAIALHAKKLVIDHPVTGKRMVFESESDFRI
jgi:23S rRNA pseudouridine955/2504/2580 synthase/23S rRNA pseudouridine1911/1915/1917 synthase